jgi:hypothetical protein
LQRCCLSKVESARGRTREVSNGSKLRAPPAFSARGMYLRYLTDVWADPHGARVPWADSCSATSNVHWSYPWHGVVLPAPGEAKPIARQCEPAGTTRPERANDARVPRRKRCALQLHSSRTAKAPGGLGNGFCVQQRLRTRATLVAMDRNRWLPCTGTSGRLRRNAQISRPFPLGRNIDTPPVAPRRRVPSGLAASKIGIEPQYRNGARLIKVQFPEC